MSEVGEQLAEATSKRGFFSIDANVPFAAQLAAGILETWGEDPLALAKITLYLPTRRSCRSVQDAFLEASEGRALILPRMIPLGDLDDEELLLSDESDGALDLADEAVPPAMPELRRTLLLSVLIRKWEESRREGERTRLGDEHAIRLAKELARFLDSVESEGLSLEALKNLVPDSYARHWRETLDFLEILLDWWPAIEAEEGTIGPAKRRALLAAEQVAHWSRNPPLDPVIIAGSTGSVPATRALAAAVLKMPQGAVVLPGLDLEADEALWDAIGADPTHPQYGLAVFLTDLGYNRDDVQLWPGGKSHAENIQRWRFLEAALLPAAAAERWSEVAGEFPKEAIADLSQSLCRVDCADPGEEARAIALLLRETLEVPGRTAALVTPDRTLARRVASELGRWGIALDDSAGIPLMKTTPGNFLRLLAEAAAENWTPISLLALLKHPLAAGGLAPGAFRRQVRALERAVLRGPRPAPGLQGITHALDGVGLREDLMLWWDGVARCLSELAELFEGEKVPLNVLLRAHLKTSETLAESDRESGADRLWCEDAGEAAAVFLADLLSQAHAAQPIWPRAYPRIFDALIEGRVVRPKYGRHPRLMVLGPLEARLQRFDRLVLGGMNEGVWPMITEPGPWLSRPMREAFGLPSPERRIGLSAHDFLSACSAGELFLTRAKRMEGSPTVPSRWLLRMDALTAAIDEAAKAEVPEKSWVSERSWASWAETLDLPEVVRPCLPPEPRPPLSARPTRLSVTRIEAWMRDPYGLYAERILRLRALDPIDADPSAADRGTMMHAVLERFVAAFPDTLPQDAEERLVEMGREAFAGLDDRPGLKAFWWPRFCRVAEWVVAQEREERGTITRSFAELSGKLVLELASGDFEITAKADRIDQLQDGGHRILDYKTGQPPKKSLVLSGPACQLPLEAAIAISGGFEALGPASVTNLSYWRLSGGVPAGEVRDLKVDAAQLAEETLDRVTRLVEAFQDPKTPYPAIPRADWAPDYSDYGHLARLKEWGVAEEDDG